MTSQSIVVGKEETARLLNRLLKDCGWEQVKAVLPGKEQQKKLLVVDSPEMLRWVQGFPQCLAEYTLREDPRFAGVKLTTYSLENDRADYTARGLHTTPEGYKAFEIVGTGCIGRVRLRMLPACGEELILIAASAAVVCGAPFAQVLSSLHKIF
ncbi:MAG TPA: hypothetical protein DHW78_04375 [Ruminococcaceae bacterium]|jgi:hypothetical protein|nr:hypothetical protein [Oscillospiraceae bacterium]HCC03138.1 hypothetical protein [Oscillospiraceae bacterium]HCM23549.1 hypothetical protein [Oscillospiraceae bacterium]